MSEKRTVTDPCVRLLRKAGAWGFLTTGVAHAGIPDYSGVYNGHPLVLEFKQPGASPTRRQIHQLQRATAAGAIAHVIDNVDDLRQLLASIDRKDQQP